MKNDIARILISEAEINECCQRLGKQIEEDYKDKNPIVVGLLKGCEPFMSDLIKKIGTYIRTDYMDCSSYVGTESRGTILIKKDMDEDVRGQDVIVVGVNALWKAITVDSVFGLEVVGTIERALQVNGIVAGLVE